MNRKITSFTSIVKEEIITKPFVETRIKAMLAAFFKANGRYLISNKENRLEFQSEHAKIAKYIYVTIKDLFHIDPRFAYTQVTRFGRKTSYHVLVESNVDEILTSLNISFINVFSLKEFLKTEDEIAGYLAGVFLSSGSVNDPESSNYHLEMSSPDEIFIREVGRLMVRQKAVRLEPKIIKRRSNYVLYLKKSDQIADFLILIGATDATLEFENVRVARDYANSDNRWQICETANMEKTIRAAAHQLEDIKFLDQLFGIDQLPNEKMIALAKLRLDDESASMLELSKRLAEILGKPVSKSSVAHVFRAIHGLADRYRS
ncbi:MAG TPA: DNA-binding protein WhiA [Firmicutes bacterium]|jgi:hypothetical protein|nr:DNA-binding protein WhiA [Bacillota bacterium]